MERSFMDKADTSKNIGRSVVNNPEKSAIKNAIKNADKSVIKNAIKRTIKSTEKDKENGAEKSTAKSADKSAGVFADRNSEKYTDRTAGRTVNKATNKATGRYSYKKPGSVASEPMRLNKYLSACGVCSRREADHLIELGRVTVGGDIADMGMKVTERDDVRVDGKPVQKHDDDVILAVCKPMGIVCTTARHTNEDNIVDMLDYPIRVFPVGRLDKMSEGLILMTNLGEISDKILRGSNRHEKEYQVHISSPVTDSLLEKLRSGVPILDTVTRPCKAWKTGEKSFNIVLTQGLNRQIRRMCEACGVKVTHLRRIRVMNIKLGSLKPGEYRVVDGEEKRKLLSML